MPKLLDQATEVVRRLPVDSQDDIARTILHLARSELEAEPVDPAHLAAVLEGLAQAKRREYATDDEVEAAFRRFDWRSCDTRRVRHATLPRLPSTCVPVIRHRRSRWEMQYCALCKICRFFLPSS